MYNRAIILMCFLYVPMLRRGFSFRHFAVYTFSVLASFLLVFTANYSYAYNANMFTNIVDAKASTSKWKASNSSSFSDNKVQDVMKEEAKTVSKSTLTSSYDLSSVESVQAPQASEASLVAASKSKVTPFVKSMRLVSGDTAMSTDQSADSFGFDDFQEQIVRPNQGMHKRAQRAISSDKGDRVDEFFNKEKIAAGEKVPSNPSYAENESIFPETVNSADAFDTISYAQPVQQSSTQNMMSKFRKNGVNDFNKKPKQEYYIKYVVEPNTNIDIFANTFHATVPEVINAFEFYEDDIFSPSKNSQNLDSVAEKAYKTEMIVPVKHYVKYGDETISQISSKYGISSTEVELTNQSFIGRVPADYVILPILDTKRKIKITNRASYGTSQASPTFVPSEGSVEEEVYKSSYVNVIPTKSPMNVVVPVQRSVDESGVILPSFIGVIPFVRPVSLFSVDEKNTNSAVATGDVSITESSTREETTRQSQLQPEIANEVVLDAKVKYANFPIDRKDFIGEALESLGVNAKFTRVFAHRGAIVFTKSGGTVLYVGRNIRSYNNVVVIQHSDDSISTYANLAEVYIHMGQGVLPDEKIGRVSSSMEQNEYFIYGLKKPNSTHASSKDKINLN